MRVDSTSLYTAQQLYKLYQSQSTSSDDESSYASTTASTASLVDYLTTSSTEDSMSLEDIQADMLFGQNSKFKMEQNEEMEVFKDSADAIVDSDEDVTSDDMLEMLSELQASMTSMTPEVSGLTADTDLSSLSDDEIEALYTDVKSTLTDMKANGPEEGPPPMPPQFSAMLDAYGSSDSSDSEYTIEEWLEQLQSNFSSSDTYSATELSELLQSIAG